MVLMSPGEDWVKTETEMRYFDDSEKSLYRETLNYFFA